MMIQVFVPLSLPLLEATWGSKWRGAVAPSLLSAFTEYKQQPGQQVLVLMQVWYMAVGAPPAVPLWGGWCQGGIQPPLSCRVSSAVDAASAAQAGAAAAAHLPCMPWPPRPMLRSLLIHPPGTKSVLLLPCRAGTCRCCKCSAMIGAALQVLSADVNFGYQRMGYQRAVSYNGTPLHNLAQLAALVEGTQAEKEPFMVFGLDQVGEGEGQRAARACMVT